MNIPHDLIKTPHTSVWAAFRERVLAEGLDFNLAEFARSNGISQQTAYNWRRAIEDHTGLTHSSNRGRPQKAPKSPFPKKPRTAKRERIDKKSTPSEPTPKVDSIEARRKYQEALDRAMEYAKPNELAALTRARAEITSGMSAPKVNLDVKILLGKEGEDEAKKRLAETFKWLLDHDKLPEELRLMFARPEQPLLVSDTDD